MSCLTLVIIRLFHKTEEAVRYFFYLIFFIFCIPCVMCMCVTRSSICLALVQGDRARIGLSPACPRAQPRPWGGLLRPPLPWGTLPSALPPHVPRVSVGLQ